MSEPEFIDPSQIRPGPIRHKSLPPELLEQIRAIYDILGDVYLGDRHINLEMVQDGLAWHYKQYSKSKELAEAEDEARKEKKGLWADKEPMPPWEFRKMKREKTEKR